MTDRDRTALIGNIVGPLGRAQKRIQMSQTALFYKADEEYGRRIAEGLQLDVNHIKKLAGMPQEERVQATLEQSRPSSWFHMIPAPPQNANSDGAGFFCHSNLHLSPNDLKPLMLFPFASGTKSDKSRPRPPKS